METLVLSTLLLQSLAFVTLALCVAVGACQRDRKARRDWTALESFTLAQTAATGPDVIELPRAA